ncbi:MAG: hypothetical protein WA061_02405 [Microgenomates group bacterium]
MALRISSTTQDILALAGTSVSVGEPSGQGNDTGNLLGPGSKNAIISTSGYVSYGINPPTSFGNFVGAYFGYDTAPQMSLFSNENNFLQWDGSRLLVQAQNFTLDANGNITATSATLSGAITATSGAITGIMTIGDITNNYLILDGTTAIFKSSNYVAGSTGFQIDGVNGNAEFNNIVARGKIKTSVFEKDTISAIGGTMYVLPADVLLTDMTALDTCYLETEADESFAIGNILRMKDGIDDEWFEVSEIVVNGTFSSDTAWTKGTGWTIGSNVATASTATGFIEETAGTLVSGKTYIITYVVTRTAGDITAYIGANKGSIRSSSGTYSDTIVADGTVLKFGSHTAGTFSGTLDTVSVIGVGYYKVTRDKASAYTADDNPLWKKGQAVVNYGSSGSGGIIMTSGENSSLTLFNHTGTPWDSGTVTNEVVLSESGISAGDGTVLLGRSGQTITTSNGVMTFDGRGQTMVATGGQDFPISFEGTYSGNTRYAKQGMFIPSGSSNPAFGINYYSPAGANLVSEPGFETVSTWTLDAEWSRSSANKRSGTYSLLAQNTSYSTYKKATSSSISVTAGLSYGGSIYLYGISGSAYKAGIPPSITYVYPLVRISLEWYTSAPALIKTDYIMGEASFYTSAWTVKSGTFIAPAGAATVKIVIEEKTTDYATYTLTTTPLLYVDDSSFGAISISNFLYFSPNLVYNNGTYSSAVLTSDPRVFSESAYATAPNSDNYEVHILTAQNAAFTIAAPTGTPQQGRKMIFRFKDNGTARAITWNTIYRGIGLTLPATTVISKTLYVGAFYNSTDAKWDVISVGQEV